MPGSGPDVSGPNASTHATARGGGAVLRVARALGAILGYGGLAAFVYLIGMQVYHWFRDGEWTRFGVTEGMRVGLAHCCVKDGDTGRLAALAAWLDSPVDWIGLHKVLEVIPASLALFALSVLGNSIFIYCRDRIENDTQ